MTDKEARKKKITERRQQQILKAAGDIFARKGYAAATVPEIAEAAGVAVGTIYNYYAGKRELFIAVIKSLIITVPLLDLFENLHRGDFAVTFQQILQNRFKLVESETVARIPSLMGEIQRDPELKALWAKDFLRPFLDKMEVIYRAMAASGKIRHIEPAIATRAIGGLILGFAMLKIMEGETSPLRRMPDEEVSGALMNLIFHGLATASEEAKNRKEDIP